MAVGLFADEPMVPIQELMEGGTPPKPIKRNPPIYPKNMYRSGFEGRVWVSFVIDTDGRAINPVVTQSNNPWFERPAIEAVLQWRFQPGEIKGRKVNVRANQLLEFELDNVTDSVGGLWGVKKKKHPDDLVPELRWEVAPRPLNTAFPVYPFEALVAERPGTTQIKFIVEPSGRVGISQLSHASDPAMGQAVLAMIDTWEFTPPMNKAGEPCYAALTLEHEFKPHNYGNVPISEEALKILKKLEKKPEEIVAPSQLDALPKPLSRRPPVYPTSLRRNGQPGEAVIEFFIAPNGDAELPRIISSTAPEFGYAAAQAVATWRFEPPRKGGKPATTRVQIPIEFTGGTPLGTAQTAAPAKPQKNNPGSP